MPHFVIDCSENILTLQQPDKILQEVHKSACSTGLFNEADIKVRLNPFKEHYLVGGKRSDFIHVFANIMEGRNYRTESKSFKTNYHSIKVFVSYYSFYCH